MLNGISKRQRLDRTLAGIQSQQDDFFWIIEEYVCKLTEKQLKDLYELEEDIKKENKNVI